MGKGYGTLFPLSHDLHKYMLHPSVSQSAQELSDIEF